MSSGGVALPQMWCRCRQCRRHCSDSSLATLVLPPKDKDDYGDLQQLKTSVIIYEVLLPGFISQLEMTRRNIGSDQINLQIFSN